VRAPGVTISGKRKTNEKNNPMQSQFLYRRSQ
jgi:hypothetical protein